MNAKAKLYHLTSQDFRLPFHIDKDRQVMTSPAQDIPMLSWPDGRWCLPANVYMLELYHRGLSRKNHGGTLLTYAANISHLLRYCHDNKTDLPDLTDNQFAFFMKTLQGERRVKAPEVHARDANSVIAIGRNCLDFLASVGRLHQDDDFIGPKGRIRAEQKEFEIRTEGVRNGKGKLIRKYWHHRSFPTPDPKNKRLPISSDIVDQLRKSVESASGSIYQRKRRYAMLKLLEVTGGRRSEIAALTVESVYEASRMQEPALKLMTAKKPGGREEFRCVPIANHDVAFLVEFVEKNRRRIIRKTCGHDNDGGYVLVSETTGRKLEPNTITQEVAILANAAGVKEKSCPHMFRHRFITKLFVALIEQHKFENEDDFRRALLDTETIKQKIQQWTGHANLSSLDVYINLAFEEAANFKKTYDVVSLRRAVDSFKASVDQVRHEVRNGASPNEASRQLQKIIEAFDADLDGHQDSENDPEAPLDASVRLK
jgi:site-specific recombinase XerD